jgi:hypothetical protein
MTERATKMLKQPNITSNPNTTTTAIIAAAYQRALCCAKATAISTLTEGHSATVGVRRTHFTHDCSEVRVCGADVSLATALYTAVSPSNRTTAAHANRHAIEFKLSHDPTS